MTQSPADWCAPEPTPSPYPEPNVRQRGVTFGALCSMGWRPIMITGLIRDVLIRHFTQPNDIEDADLRKLVWREDERTSILIESIHRWRGTLVEKRPALLVKRNSYRNLRMTIGDSAGTDEQGNLIFCTFWVGSHTLFCLHGSGASAEILATECQRQLTEFGPLLVSQLGLLRFCVAEVGAIAELEEAKENFVIPVTVAWAYEEKWALPPDALKLRKAKLSMLLDGALIQDEQ